MLGPPPVRLQSYHQAIAGKKAAPGAVLVAMPRLQPVIAAPPAPPVAEAPPAPPRPATPPEPPVVPAGPPDVPLAPPPPDVPDVPPSCDAEWPLPHPRAATQTEATTANALPLVT